MSQNLGVMIAGGGGSRHPEDFYSTPREATVALLNVTAHLIGPVVHEPACGSGSLARVLAEHGFSVVATDLVYRGYGVGGVDFLKDRLRAPSAITNPPFKLAAEFIEHGCSQEPEFYALLLKATFWHARSRATLFDRFPPKMTLPLTWRLDFTGQRAPTMDCTWFVWGSRVPGPAAPALLHRAPDGVFA